MQHIKVCLFILCILDFRIQSFRLAINNDRFHMHKVLQGKSLSMSSRGVVSAVSQNITSKSNPMVDMLLKIPPISYVHKKYTGIRDFFRIQLPMLQYLWPSDNLRLRIFLVLSFIFMFMGKVLLSKVPFMLQVFIIF